MRCWVNGGSTDATEEEEPGSPEHGDDALGWRQQEGPDPDHAEGLGRTLEEEGGQVMGATIQRRKHSYRIAIHQHGERAYKSVKTLAEAKMLLQAIHKAEVNGVNVVIAIEQARTAQPTTEYPTLQAAATTWLDGQIASREIRHSTGETYRGRLQRWVFPTLGSRPVNTIIREQIGEIITTVKATGLSRAVVDQIRNPLVRCFADLVERKILTVNPAADLKHFIGKRPATVSTVPKFFTVPEATRLLRAVRACYPGWSTFIQVGLQGGLRFGEISALHQSDIDWRKAKIHVQRTQSMGGRIEPPKTRHGDRWVKASPTLLAALKAQCEAATLEGQVKGWSPEQRQWVFPNSKGHVRRYSNFLLMWKALLAKTGLQYRRFHGTRHTYGTTMAESGTDLRYLRDQMGHASVKMTGDLYAHAVPERHEDSVKVLDAMITAR
jgi:integrase